MEFKSILLIEQKVKSSACDSLKRCCKSLFVASALEEALNLLKSVDAVVIHSPEAQMLELRHAIARNANLPLYWINNSPNQPMGTDWGYSLDGLLFSTMSDEERRLALSWGFRCYQQKKRWYEERNKLLQRIEERKWIDQAKTILCEIKAISENEAYEFLRKQAMNEQKRVGEVAANIVKVYQLIHE